MSRKHNTRHNRKRSRYPERLRKRGLTNVDVRMDDLATLRRTAVRGGAKISVEAFGPDDL